MEQLEIAADVHALVGLLEPRDAEVVLARYGLNGPRLTLRELSSEMGLSVERVRQIEMRALRRMGAHARRGPRQPAVVLEIKRLMRFSGNNPGGIAYVLAPVA